MMDKKKRSKIEMRLAEALLSFVERATEEHATPEEMAALPGVACVLKDMLALGESDLAEKVLTGLSETNLQTGSNSILE